MKPLEKPIQLSDTIFVVESDLTFMTKYLTIGVDEKPILFNKDRFNDYLYRLKTMYNGDDNISILKQKIAINELLLTIKQQSNGRG